MNEVSVEFFLLFNPRKFTKVNEKKVRAVQSPFSSPFPGFVVKHFDFDRYLLSNKNG